MTAGEEFEVGIRVLGALQDAEAALIVRAFETVPNGPDAIGRRSFFVFEAHRLYQLAHDAGSEAGLCADARVLDTFAAQLASLKPSERDALVLRYVAELSHREIATACNIDEAAARKRVSRALDALRTVIPAEEIE